MQEGEEKRDISNRRRSKIVIIRYIVEGGSKTNGRSRMKMQ